MVLTYIEPNKLLYKKVSFNIQNVEFDTKVCSGSLRRPRERRAAWRQIFTGKVVFYFGRAPLSTQQPTDCTTAHWIVAHKHIGS